MTKNKEILKQLLLDVAKIACNKEKLEDLKSKDYQNIVLKTGGKFTQKALENWCKSYPYEYNLNVLSHFVLSYWNSQNKLTAENEKLNEMLTEVEYEDIDKQPFFNEYIELVKRKNTNESKPVIKKESSKPNKKILLIMSSLIFITAGYFLLKKINNNNFKNIAYSESSDISTDITLIKKFEGLWVGRLEQEIIRKDIVSVPDTIHIDLDRDNDSLKGKFEFIISENEQKNYISYFSIIGFVVESNGNFIKLDYRCNSEDCLSFGSMILEINSLRNEMQGKFIGYGSTNEALIKGDIFLKKLTN